MGEICAEKILAIETSGKMFSVALAERYLPGCRHLSVGYRRDRTDEFVLKGELNLDIGLRHSEVLKDACDFLLKKCGWEKAELTLLAVSIGPGSFTGLRVGISFARAVAQSLNIPLIGIPTFQILAMGLNSFYRQMRADKKKYPQNLCVCIDSIGNEVYTGFFKDACIQPSQPYKIYSIPNLCKKIERFCPRRISRRETSFSSGIVFLGEGFLRYEKELRKAAGNRAVSLSKELNYARAKYLAEIVSLRKISRRQTISKASRANPLANSWQKVVPFYLRPPMAVERLQKIQSLELRV